MNKIYYFFPDVEPDEAGFLSELLKDKTDDEIRNFILIYRARRRDPQLILFTCLLGFVVLAGVHRFLLNHIGMGILYLFTGGLCLIGTIVDLVNYKTLAFEYNRKIAIEVLAFYR